MALPPGNEFDYARKRAAQQEGANLQTQKDALERRQAQLGAGVRGAMIKQEQVASDASAQRLAQANEGIDTAQRAEERRIREIEEGRRFATSEREAGQAFTRGEREGSQAYGADQAAIQRRFQTGEREAGQAFTSGESAMQRRFVTGERVGSQDFAAEQALAQQKFATGERLGTQDFAAAQALKQQQFQTGERLGSQEFAKGERQGSQQFAKQQQADQLAQQKMLAQKQITAQQYAQKQEFAQQKSMAEFAAEKQKYAQEVANAYDWQKVQTQLGFSREQFEHEKQVDAFNMDMANKMFNERDMLEKILMPNGVGEMYGIGQLFNTLQGKPGGIRL